MVIDHSVVPSPTPKEQSNPPWWRARGIRAEPAREEPAPKSRQLTHV